MTHEINGPYHKPSGDLMLVPTEPTIEMLNAYDEARAATSVTAGGVETYNPHQSYYAFLAASPKNKTLNDVHEDGRNIERARCAAIVSAARMGEIDGDFRALLSRINGGDPFPESKTE